MEVLNKTFQTQRYWMRPFAMMVAAACAALGHAQATDIEEVVVIGNKEVQLIDASNPFTSISEEDLVTRAPRNIADALEAIPSLQTSSALGNTDNQYRIRGIGAGGTQFLELEEDGIPISRDAPDWMYKVTNTATGGIDVVRGGFAPILRTAAIGAVVNFKNKEGSLEEHEGNSFVQSSDFGMRRAEAWFGGPLTERISYSLSGYYTTDRGVREVDYAANQGYNIHTSLKYHFADDSGHFKVSGRAFEENNIVYLGTPLRGSLEEPEPFPGGPEITTGSLLSQDIAMAYTFSGPNQPSLLDLRNGNANPMSYFGSELIKAWDLGNGVNVELISRNRITTIGGGFSGFYLAGWALQDGGDFQTGETLVPKMLNSNTMGAGLVNYSYAMPEGFVPVTWSVTDQSGNKLDQGTISDANNNGTFEQGEAVSTAASPANGNGLFIPFAAFDQGINEGSLQQDFELNFSFATGDIEHYASVGYYYVKYDRGKTNRQQLMLMDLQQQANRVDVRLQDADGAEVVLTDGGFLTHNHWLANEMINDVANAVYATYEIDVGNLRVDVGLRHDDFGSRFRNTRTTNVFGDGPNQIPLPEPGTTASPAVTSMQRYDGSFFTVHDFTTSEMAYTVGGNYRVFDNLGTYARYTQAYLPLPNGATGTTAIELGARYQIDNFGIAANFFSMAQDGDVQDRGINIDGTQVTARLQTDRLSSGFEFEGYFDIVESLRVIFTATFQSPKFASDASATLEPGSTISQARLNEELAKTAGIDGKRISNQNELLANFGVEYTLALPGGSLLASFTARHVGDAPVNDDNTRFFEAYTRLNFGLIYESERDDWYARLNIQNLTDENAILRIEGGSTNTSLTGGDIGADGFFGRALEGRNILLGLGYRF